MTKLVTINSATTPSAAMATRLPRRDVGLMDIDGKQGDETWIHWA